MNGHDQWKTDAPDDGCERCAGLEECICEEERQQAIDDNADAQIEVESLTYHGYDLGFRRTI